MANFFQKALGSVVGSAGLAYDYLTPGKGSSRVTNWGANYAFGSPTPKTPSGPSGTVRAPTPAPSAPDTSGLDAQIAALNRQTAALEAQIAAQPRLPYYNTSAAWAQAQKAASGVVDPVYTDKLNQYLQKEQLGIKQQTAEQQAQEAASNTALQQAIEDFTTNTNRENQDLSTNLGDVKTAETNYQRDSGTQFDAARAALLGTIANSGLTTSGIGRQQETAAVGARNTQEAEQQQSFDQQRRDFQTKATRNIEDLTTGKTRTEQKTAIDIADQKRALQDYIDSAAVEEQGFRTQNEADRLAAIANEAQNQYKIGVGNFIQSLIGGGARAQDIALAQQVYG